MDTNDTALAEQGYLTLIRYLVSNGVDRTYAEIFVRQQLTEYGIYQDAAIFPYNGRQYSKTHYDELGKLLLEASGRGSRRREEDAAKATAAENARNEVRSRVASAF